MIKTSIEPSETRTQAEIGAIAAPKVSVVLPVYNVAKYIGQCIDSLKSQSFKELEFIFVDDASTDDSVRHIEAFAAEDDRVRLIRNEKNIGPGGSRNAGIAAARGEFVSFVDPDDHIAPDFYEKLYKKAFEEKLDIAKGQRTAEFEDGSKAGADDLNGRIRKGLENGKPLYLLFDHQHQSAIYRLAPIREYGVCYGSTRKSEDMTFLLQTCRRLTNIGFDDSAIYYHIQRHGSLTLELSANTLEWNISAVREQMAIIETSMSSEPHASEYMLGRIRHVIRVCDRIGALHGAKSIEAYIPALRELALRIPLPDDIERNTFSARALCYYSRLLPNRPLKLPWQREDAGECIRILKLWLGFIEEHPERAEDADNDIRKLFALAQSAARKAPCGSRKYLRELRFLKMRLRLRRFGIARLLASIGKAAG